MNGALEHMSVLIPARNEEELLPRCLRSIFAACSLLPLSVSWDVVVAVDSSTDSSFEIAECMLHGRGVAIRTDAGAVGKARALAAAVALKRYRGPRSCCWLANTDADCSVPETWLRDQWELAAANVEAFAGTVDVDSFGEHRAGVDDLFRASYRIFSDGTHPHVHGANLGVRADAYLRVGGWRHLETAEDHDLWNRLRIAGSRRASVGRMRVLTSGRKVGRAPYGFAQALAAHDEVAA
jgi:glycosyltransferase involved in cell wall biosynthesis